MNMFKKTSIAMAVLAGCAFTTQSFAGNIVFSETSYATEDQAVGGGTFTPTAIEYVMGVDRAVGQEFVIIYDLPAGNTFDTQVQLTDMTGTCITAGTCTVTLKRGGSTVDSQVAFAVSPVGVGVVDGDTFTFNTPALDGYDLSAAGNTATLEVSLKDSSENSFVDNVGPLTAYLARGADASYFSDGTASRNPDGHAFTTTDVNLTVPLAGFFVEATDARTIAAANTTALSYAGLQIINTTANVMDAANTAAYVLQPGDTVTLTVTDPTQFTGLAAGGLCYDMDDSGTCGIGEIFTVPAASQTATLAIAGSSLDGALHDIIWTSNGITPLGTSRSIGISAQVDPALSAAATRSYSSRSDFAVWDSNGSILETPWFTTSSNWNSSFNMMNKGSSPVTYTITVGSDQGAPSLTPAVNGSIPAASGNAPGMAVIAIADLFAEDNTVGRANATFTINSPIENVKGTFKMINPFTGAITTNDLKRPYGTLQTVK